MRLWRVQILSPRPKFNNDKGDNYLSQDKDRYIINDSPNSQFSDLIDASFSLIKDISHDFEVGIYFFQPDSNLLELKSFPNWGRRSCSGMF